MTTVTTAKQSNSGRWRASDAAGWISLAASPAFALMACIAASHAPRMAICSSVSDLSAIDGMAWMYLLMSLFHLPSWLKLASGRPR